MEPLHITTAIFYSNAAPHVGSAYEALAADVFARYQRRKLGRHRVTFLSGTDEHGDKIRRAAAAANLPPQEFTDRISPVFRKTWDGLNVSYDFFVRTTDPEHQQFVQKMLRITYERGDIYFRDYQGLYCVGCERFYTEKELLPGNICPEHNRPVELINEGNYFLRIEKYRPRVLDKLASDPDFIRPERYRNEALKMLAEPLMDLCISRPKLRMDWGIELPFDSKYVTYVWYDAFWAYLSIPASRDPKFIETVWPHTQHFIGKDILKTHAVYWPPILMAAGLPLFRHLDVHGFLNFGGGRMSKSSGNVLDPVRYEQPPFCPDLLRYFVMREFSYGLDGDFSEDRMIERYNSDLANNLGNLVSRVLTMAKRFSSSAMAAVPFADGEQSDQPLAQALGGLHERTAELIDQLAFNRALEVIWQTLDLANKYIVEMAPFSLARDSANKPRVAQILANLLEGLRLIAAALEPFMPETVRRISAMLRIDDELLFAPLGEGLKPGHQLGDPIALFPRIEKPKSA
jgi:methionyl-tRNA synthetase